MAALDIPVLQGLCLTSSRAEWEAYDDGVTPLDSANQIAIPEFDGRIITAPFSFKEIDERRPPRLRRRPGAHAPAWPASPSTTPGCAASPTRESSVALVLSAYPTKHSRIGNAVGLDTPVSAIRLLRRLPRRGYDLGPDDDTADFRSTACWTWATTPRPATR